MKHMKKLFLIIIAILSFLAIFLFVQNYQQKKKNELYIKYLTPLEVYCNDEYYRLDSCYSEVNRKSSNESDFYAISYNSFDELKQLTQSNIHYLDSDSFKEEKCDLRFVEQKDCEYSYYWYQSDEKKIPTKFNDFHVEDHSGDILLIQKEVYVDTLNVDIKQEYALWVK